MRYLLDAVLLFLTLGLSEAVIKPLAKRFVQRRLLAAADRAMLLHLQQELKEATEQGYSLSTLKGNIGASQDKRKSLCRLGICPVAWPFA